MSSSSGSSPRKTCRSRVRVRAWAGPSRSQEIAWLGASVLGLLVLALISLYGPSRAGATVRGRERARGDHDHNGHVAAHRDEFQLRAVAGRRIYELVRRAVRGGHLDPLVGDRVRPIRPFMPRFSGRRDWVPRAACVALAAALYMAAIWPPSVRAYFESSTPT